MKIPDLDPKFEAMFEKLVKETVFTNNQKLDKYGTETDDIETEDGRCYTVCTSVSPENSTWSRSLGTNFWLGVRFGMAEASKMLKQQSDEKEQTRQPTGH